MTESCEPDPPDEAVVQAAEHAQAEEAQAAESAREADDTKD